MVGTINECDRFPAFKGAPKAIPCEPPDENAKSEDGVSEHTDGEEKLLDWENEMRDFKRCRRDVVDGLLLIMDGDWDAWS